MFPYFRSTQGRLLALAMALPLASGAIVPFTAQGAGSFTIPILVAICIAFLTAGFSIEEFPGAALTAVLALPFALFFYILTIGIVVPQVHGVVYIMAAAACGLLAVAARPGLPAPRKTETRVPRTA
jgi:hypothetical protein